MSGESRTELRDALPSSTTLICTETHAQFVYDELFDKKPKFFRVYEEDEEDAHIYVRFPMPVHCHELMVEIAEVVRNAQNELIAYVVPDNNTLLSVELAAFPKEQQPQIMLGQFTAYRLQEVEYLQRMKRNLPGYLLSVIPGADPELQGFI